MTDDVLRGRAAMRRRVAQAATLLARRSDKTMCADD